jgi:hypothetical protein
MIKILEFKEHEWDTKEALRVVAIRGKTVDCRKMQFADLKRLD